MTGTFALVMTAWLRVEKTGSAEYGPKKVLIGGTGIPPARPEAADPEAGPTNFHHGLRVSLGLRNDCLEHIQTTE